MSSVLCGAGSVAGVRAVHVLAAASSLAVLASSAIGQASAVLASPKPVPVSITMSLVVSTALGTSSDSDTKVVGATAVGDALLYASLPPWNSVQMNGLVIDPDDALFHFDLFCFPFIGCQSLDIALTDFALVGGGVLESAVATNGAISVPNAPFVLVGNYATSGISTSSGVLDDAVSTNFGGRVQALPGNLVQLDQLTLAPVTMSIDPASLPPGLTGLTITITANLSGLAMSGFWSVSNPYDLDGDGLVAAADVAILLGGWGSPGPADFDGDGQVGAPDLATLLAAWTS